MRVGFYVRNFALAGAMSAAVVAGTLSAATQTASAADAVTTTPAPAKIFDELRFGASGSIQNGSDHENGIFPDVQALFNPFGYNPNGDWKEQLSHPRIHVGTSIGTSSTAATQVYAGLSWTMTYSNGIFTEAGFGGVVHNGNLTKDNDGPRLGCHLLFHEYLGAGYNFDSHWSLMAQINHSSHANLCDGPNSGMTRAGLLVGYKF